MRTASFLAAQLRSGRPSGAGMGMGQEDLASTIAAGPSGSLLDLASRGAQLSSVRIVAATGDLQSEVLERQSTSGQEQAPPDVSTPSSPSQTPNAARNSRFWRESVAAPDALSAGASFVAITSRARLGAAAEVFTVERPESPRRALGTAHDGQASFTGCKLPQICQPKVGCLPAQAQGQPLGSLLVARALLADALAPCAPQPHDRAGTPPYAAGTPGRPMPALSGRPRPWDPLDGDSDGGDSDALEEELNAAADSLAKALEAARSAAAAVKASASRPSAAVAPPSQRGVRAGSAPAGGRRGGALTRPPSADAPEAGGRQASGPPGSGAAGGGRLEVVELEISGSPSRSGTWPGEPCLAGGAVYVAKRRSSDAVVGAGPGPGGELRSSGSGGTAWLGSADGGRAGGSASSLASAAAAAASAYGGAAGAGLSGNGEPQPGHPGTFAAAAAASPGAQPWRRPASADGPAAASGSAAAAARLSSPSGLTGPAPPLPLWSPASALPAGGGIGRGRGPEPGRPLSAAGAGAAGASEGGGGGGHSGSLKELFRAAKKALRKSFGRGGAAVGRKGSAPGAAAAAPEERDGGEARPGPALVVRPHSPQGPSGPHSGGSGAGPEGAGGAAAQRRSPVVIGPLVAPPRLSAGGVPAAPAHAGVAAPGLPPSPGSPAPGPHAGAQGLPAGSSPPGTARGGWESSGAAAPGEPHGSWAGGHVAAVALSTGSPSPVRTRRRVSSAAGGASELEVRS
jgi:hypothetical protein